MYSVTDSISNSKEFSFSGVDIGSMMNSFGNDFLTSENIRDWDNNIIFDTYICYDEYNVFFYEWLFVYIV